ncbi:MAG: FtsL-like putative cell division protein [Cyclobacteriaceae bacterium]|nr:FtsL-like putative cell division protein [Cyclobacteriaceae bacterium]
MKTTKNTFKVDEQQSEGSSIFSRLENAIKTDIIFENGFPLKYLPQLLFSIGLCIFYIGNSHYAEKTIRRIDKTKKEVSDLRADYTTLKADYMLASKQSEVANRVKEQGIYESMQPPSKIEIIKGEY